ncbi:MAG: chemotaxis protein CheX [Treponema sp.]|jgi:chemotaxis protein CheX|nr:chemotaxis protein CheX [Treponema sp.]
MERYIKPFIEVCQLVFKAFVGIEIKAERPYFLDKVTFDGLDISGVIGLTGQARGAVVLSMHKSLALRLTSQLTGTPQTELNEDTMDAIGEIVNIITGNAKQKLEDSFRLVISLPTIVMGSEHTIKWPTNRTRILCIPFSVFEDEVFHLSVALEVVKDGETW